MRAAPAIFARDFRPLKNNPPILDTRGKFEEARKSPKEKKPRMAVSVDETFPQGRVGMNRARKAVARDRKEEAMRDGERERERGGAREN